MAGLGPATHDFAAFGVGSRGSPDQARWWHRRDWPSLNSPPSSPIIPGRATPRTLPIS